MKLIYCHGRSGSTQLVRCVRKYPGDQKIFFDEPFKQKNAEIHGYNKKIRDDSNLEEYIEYLNPYRVKHLWSDLPQALNERLIKNHKISSILFLYRKDLFSYAISMITASLTKEWHGASADYYGDIPIDRLFKAAEAQIEAIPANAHLVLDHAAAPVTCVSYEDLYGFSGLHAQHDAAKAAFSALGITDQEFIEESIKTMLSPDRKYKTDEYYKKLYPNFEQARMKLNDIRNYFIENPASRPEYILGKHRAPV